MAMLVYVQNVQEQETMWLKQGTHKLMKKWNKDYKLMLFINHPMYNDYRCNVICSIKGNVKSLSSLSNTPCNNGRAAL
jgi:hypothetical protein